jgi:glycosyltransferase involved in cell wall biosynthesis
MCEDLAVQARRHCPGFVHVLKDVSLIEGSGTDTEEDLRKALQIDGPMLMYIGNLETYQGIDLLLESFAKLLATQSSANLVIIGGSIPDIDKYRRKSRELDIASQTHFVGPRPVADLGYYLKQADILVSPRTQGTNTPMKIYSYLDSGVPVVATALPTHTQVMTEEEAILTPVDSAEMAQRISRLLDDERERERIAANAKRLIAREHSWTAFRENVDRIFDRLEGRIDVRD